MSTDSDRNIVPANCPNILIEQVMCEKFVAVDALPPLPETVRKLRDEGSSCVIVTVEDRPVGLISERDLTRGCYTKSWKDDTAERNWRRKS
jgi:predicted transcriptional regulator